MSESHCQELLAVDTLSVDERWLLERLLVLRGLMTAKSVERVQLTALLSVYSVMLTCDYDMVMDEANWPLFVAFVKKYSIDTNSGSAFIPFGKEDCLQYCLPFCVSFPFALSMLLLSRRAERAVLLWNAVLGTESDVCQGLLQQWTVVMRRSNIQSWCRRLADGETAFEGDISYGWSLSSLLLSETADFIESEYGEYF